MSLSNKKKKKKEKEKRQNNAYYDHIIFCELQKINARLSGAVSRFLQQTNKPRVTTTMTERLGVTADVDTYLCI